MTPHAEPVNAQAGLLTVSGRLCVLKIVPNPVTTGRQHPLLRPPHSASSISAPSGSCQPVPRCLIPQLTITAASFRWIRDYEQLAIVLRALPITTVHAREIC